MSEPTKKSYMVPVNCPADVELMSIWVQAADEYFDMLTDNEAKAAINWFSSFISSKIDKGK